MEITEEDKIKFEKCREYMQLGILCDVHPTCKGCEYQISDEIYEALGGKLIK